MDDDSRAIFQNAHEFAALLEPKRRDRILQDIATRSIDYVAQEAVTLSSGETYPVPPVQPSCRQKM